MALSKGKYPLEHLGIKIARGDVVVVQDDDSLRERILWPNFSGSKTPYNSEGDRNFNIHLTKKEADDLGAEGWNVKCKLPREDDEDQIERCVLKCKVGYKVNPPRVKMIGDKSRNETLLTQENIGLLDDADIATVDLSFVPYFYTMFEGTPQETDGVAAYLKTMYVVVIEDELDMKWDELQKDARGEA
jgi:hypothetical protein